MSLVPQCQSVLPPTHATTQMRFREYSYACQRAASVAPPGRYFRGKTRRNVFFSYYQDSKSGGAISRFEKLYFWIVFRKLGENGGVRGLDKPFSKMGMERDTKVTFGVECEGIEWRVGYELVLSRQILRIPQTDSLWLNSWFNAECEGEQMAAGSAASGDWVRGRYKASQSLVEASN